MQKKEMVILAVGEKKGELCFFLLCKIVTETLVHFLVNIKNSFADLVHRPSDTGEIGIGHIPARKDFIAIAVGSKEIDGRSTRNTVTRWTKVDFDAVATEDVAGAQNIIPVVEPEREMMKLAVWAFHKSNIVRLV